MSTAAVSSLSIFQELQTFYQTRQTDVKQLGKDLQSGDLNGAQQAYKALAVLGESGPFASSEPFSTSAVPRLSMPSARPYKPATWGERRHPLPRLPPNKAVRQLHRRLRS